MTSRADYVPAPPPGEGWFRVTSSDMGYGGPGWMRITSQGNAFVSDALAHERILSHDSALAPYAASPLRRLRVRVGRRLLRPVTEAIVGHYDAAGVATRHGPRERDACTYMALGASYIGRRWPHAE